MICTCTLLFQNLGAMEGNYDLQPEGGCGEVCFGIGADKGRPSVLDFIDEAVPFSAQLFGAQP